MTTTVQIALVIVILNSYLYFELVMTLATDIGLQFLGFFSVGPKRLITASNWCLEADVADEQAWVREGAAGAEHVAFGPGWMFVSTADQCLTFIVWHWLE